MTRDRASEIIREEQEALSEIQGAALREVPDWFDEEAYLLANPDVSRSVALGQFESAYEHYVLHGHDERRPLHLPSAEPKDRLVLTEQNGPSSTIIGIARGYVELVMVSPRGGIFIVGWVDDTSAPLEWIRASGSGWFLNSTVLRTARFRRPDVETALNSVGMHSYGFCAFSYTATSFDTRGNCEVKLHLADGSEMSLGVPFRRVTEVELRNCVLSYVSEAQYFGNRAVEAVLTLQGQIGSAIVSHNRDITKEIIDGAYVRRFGPKRGKLRGSIVVCLYGKPEYLFLQNALFGGGPGFEEYELIYVCNSPELGEQLLRDVQTSTLIYNLPQTLVLLPGNAGFGAANNLAVEYASSDRILIVNPDVFPYDEDWALKHTRIIADAPTNQTALFGAPLYYEDGSLMHGGMYFEFDTGLSVEHTAMTAKRMVRVEHYGKGTPAWSTQFTSSRPIPAVTGAFISADRTWFEKLGGFTEDFVFGHYEDADLCLKSLQAGVASWIHDVKLYHLEGKGSTRLPVHEGGSYVNRALFSNRWDALISDGLHGANPTHPLLMANSGYRLT